MPGKSQLLRYTKNQASQQGTEEPTFMREIVVPQIDNGTPGDVGQDLRRSHIDADRLQYDDK